MLQLKGISKSFDRQILKSVNFILKKNEVVGLVGKSGTGKSSILKILSGRLSADMGSVFWEGQEMPNANELLIPGYKNITLVDQEFKLDTFHTVEENIRESILAWPYQKREKRIKELLSMFGLTAIANTRAEYVSGGEKQRIAIARSIANYPDVLLLDEPFSHLDSTLKQRLIEVLMSIRQKESISILLVSHDPQDILGLCDSICFVRNKKISRKYSPKGLYYNLRNIQVARLFGPLNIIEHNGEEIRFRPDEFKKSNVEKGIEVDFIESKFFAGLYHSYFSKDQATIVLYAFESLTNLKYIEIKHRNT